MEVQTNQFITPPSNERAASAILNLLRITALANERTRISLQDIMLVTQTSQDDALETLALLYCGGLLKVSPMFWDETEQNPFLSPRRTFAASLDHLVSLFSGEDWRNDYVGMRLDIAYKGDGDYTLAGWRGQDNDMERDGYIESRASDAYDTQVSRITPRGRAIYLVLGLLFPEPAVSEAA